MTSRMDPSSATRTGRTRRLLPLLGCCACLGAAGCGASQEAAISPPDADAATGRSQPETAALKREAVYRQAADGKSFALARVRKGRTILLHKGPGGPVFERLDSETKYGSQRVLSVAEMRGRWLGVTSAERPNGRLAWIDARSPSLEPLFTKLSIRVDLSRRTLQLREGNEIVQRMSVAVGRAGHDTPPGRFAVTDKLSGKPYDGVYGCCIMAISAKQPKLPDDWPGGDRIAVHGTYERGSVGSAASTGCLRARNSNLRALMKRVPLGTPVFIES